MNCCPEDGLMSVDEALARLLANVSPLMVTERVSLHDACGRTLGEDVVATLDVPPHDNSAMDGYVFRHQDMAIALDSGLPISMRIVAGDAPANLAPATAARIFTGAPIPVGADTVVMQENCRSEDDKVWFSTTSTLGANIRRRGEDIASGSTILQAGMRLRPQDVGLLASVGINEVAVVRQLRIGILSSGDELLEPGQPAQPGKIFNSNRYMLSGFLAQWGFTVVDFGVVKDSLNDTITTLKCAVDEVDVIMTTGGVSVGEEDHIKSAVETLGEMHLWRVAIKPGKPFAYGRIGSTFFIGLPGNPVSVMVTAMILGLPMLEKLQGRTPSRVFQTPLRLPARFEVTKPAKRDEFIRVRRVIVEGTLGLEAYRTQSSGALSSASWSEGLARVRKGEVVAEGDLVDYLPFEGIGW